MQSHDSYHFEFQICRFRILQGEMTAICKKHRREPVPLGTGSRRRLAQQVSRLPLTYSIARTLASLGQYIYAQDERSLYINLLIGSRYETVLRDTKLEVKMATKK